MEIENECAYCTKSNATYSFENFLYCDKSCKDRDIGLMCYICNNERVFGGCPYCKKFTCWKCAAKLCSQCGSRICKPCDKEGKEFIECDMIQGDYDSEYIIHSLWKHHIVATK